MPKPRKNEEIKCKYFDWRIYLRGEVWYADGRSQKYQLGRHSLGTKELAEAKRILVELDQRQAENFGLVTRLTPKVSNEQPLSLNEGRRLYEAFINRPVVTGGPQASTRKKYRSHLDKLLQFFESENILVWNDVTSQALNNYAAYLKKGGPPSSKLTSYTDKTVSNELTFAKQLIKWLIAEGLLPGMEPIKLKVRKPESQRPYCWRADEVAAMIEHCRRHPHLAWLGEVVVALACTGLRIAELAGLRWADVDLKSGLLSLMDETNRAQQDPQSRRLKSGRSRSFPIHHDLLGVFNRLPRSGVYVFAGPKRGRLKPDTVRRILVREVLTPLTEAFPTEVGRKGFADGRLHSFRHYFCSTCANSSTPEQMLMAWLGHRDSEMVRHYYHLHDDEARRRMHELDFLGGATGVPSAAQETHVEEEPPGEAHEVR